MSRFDLVIVGGGPTAMRALAELEIDLADGEEAVRRTGRRGPRILVVEPTTPGAGLIWDPAQPDHLSLNADAGMIDLRCPSVPLTFLEFSGAKEAYPARAHVGAYLAWCFDRLRCSRHWALTHLSARVNSVVPLGPAGGYKIAFDSGAAAVAHEVLMATGHAANTLPEHRALAGTAATDDPVEVVLEGASLTAFDIVADLTLGRGGSYARSRGGRLEYVPSGREPRRITLWSRSGESMLPKPQYSTAAESEAILPHTRALRGRAHPDRDWWLVLCRAAQAAAASHGIEVEQRSLMKIWTQPHLAAGDISAATARRWTDDLTRADGRVDSDPRWWWGRAWAGGYPDIVVGLDRAPRREQEWASFLHRAARLERWAFGPPASTIERLLELSRSRLLFAHRSPAQTVSGATALRVRAHTPGPGVLRRPRAWDTAGGTPCGPANCSTPATSPLWAALLRDGQVLVRPGERGVFTQSDGQCLRADGTISPGLSALGRPTSDATMGHDSLQRALRPEFRTWAVGFLQRYTTRLADAPTQGAKA